MKQAVLVTAYKDLSALGRLLSCFDEDFDFYIHVDKRCKEEIPFFGKTNVQVMKRYSIHWGSEKHLWAIMELFRQSCSKGPYVYYHLITASDYPVKPLSEFKTFFSSQNDKLYVDYHQLPWDHWTGEGGLERMKYYWVGNQWFDSRKRRMSFTKMLVKIQRKIHFSRNLSAYAQWYGGLTYFSVPHDAAMVIAGMSKRKTKRMTRFTHVAEEVFLQTMLVNGFPKERLVDNPLRYTVWKDNASGPALLTEKDFDDIVRSGAFFARKLETPVSGNLMNQLDEYCQFHMENK